MLLSYSRLIRINNWIKNIIIFLPIFFAQEFFQLSKLIELTLAFIAFSFITSSIYILNDILDIKEDRNHPLKLKRPLASGLIPMNTAAIIGVVLFGIGTGYFYLFSPDTLVIILIYVAIMIGYCYKFRKIAIIDVLIISSGFVLRLFIGSRISETFISFWIIIMIFLLALFIAFSKRRDDIINQNKSGRESLDGYNILFLNTSISVLVPIIIVSYLLYCTSDENIIRVGENLYITTVFVIAGFLRYLQLVFVNKKGGDPIQILFDDLGVQFSIVGWISTFGYLLYF